MLAKDKLVDEFGIKDIIEAIFLKYIYRLVSHKDTKMGDYLKIKSVNKSIESVLNNVQE